VPGYGNGLTHRYGECCFIFRERSDAKTGKRLFDAGDTGADVRGMAVRHGFTGAGYSSCSCFCMEPQNSLREA